ncbi:UDP-glucose 4-epimerase GalE [Citricoccus nitrophenolicus]|uniref:UDP-glucose 4-epimerase n=1 Tax=Citricoccus nitrophenolicus TaxID=863575 RepID=A0ABV0IHQ4_9MICC
MAMQLKWKSRMYVGEMRVLVTGGAGYIGSHACLRLLETGHEVAVLDNFRNSQMEPLRRVQQLTGKSLALCEGDVRQPESFEAFLEAWHPESIIHFAGLKSVSESVARPEDYYATNVQGTLNVAEVARTVGVRSFIFSSSATVYGAQQEVPVDEAAETSPVNPYGRSKLFAEQVLRDIHAVHPEMSVGVLRYFNPVGAHVSGKLGEDPTGTPANLMPYMARVASGVYPHLNIYGDDYATSDGTGIRDYIHVVDLVDAHLATLEALDVEPGVVTWNVGRGEGVSVAEMVSVFERVTRLSIPVQVTDRRDGDVATSFANVGKITAATKWTAQRGVEEMVRDLWKWQSANPTGYTLES